MNEIWRPIKGYDGDYLVSNLGKVKSLKYKNPKILKPRKNSSGYYAVVLCKNSIKKTLYVHRLVENAFIPNPENKPEVNHLNGDKSNNQVTNLDWVTHKQNVQHGWQTGLMENTRKATKHAWQTGLMENTRKSVSIAIESRKIPIYSKDLDLKFESCSDAVNYLKTHYFENTTFGCLQKSICNLLNNKVTKSKFDFGWEYQ